MRALITDATYPDHDIERAIVQGAGHELTVAQCRTEEDVIKAGKNVHGLLVQNAPITGRVFKELPEVKIVSRFGVGVNGVDLHSAWRAGVWVSNVTDYGVREVAVHAMSLLLALLRHVKLYDRQTNSGNWDYLRTRELRRPGEMTLGIIGCGRMGRTLAEKGGGWFDGVVGYDPYLMERDWPQGVKCVSTPEELFSRSDLISLHLPLTAETSEMVDRDLLSRLEEGSFLVNMARGGLAVLDDLLWALEVGKLAGIGLDVFPEEPPNPHPLLDHPAVICTPRAAWYSAESKKELRKKIAENVVTLFNGG